jgi:hypothetical protein
MTRRLADEPYIDFKAFYLAARAVNTGEDIYRAGLEMYIYPPMLATWMSPLGRLPVRSAAWLWYGLAVGTTLVTLRAWWCLLSDRFRLPAAGWLPAVGLALVVWVEQFRREFETGQCDWLLLGALGFAAVLLDRAPVVSGLLVGFAVNIKYVPLLVAVWLVARRRRAAAWASLAGVVVWAVLPAAVLGWEQNLDYLARAGAGLGKLVGIRTAGQPGMVYPLEYEYSVSIPSGAARVAKLLGLGREAVVPMVGSAALAAAAGTWWLYRRHGWSLSAGRRARLPVSGSGLGVLEWCGLLTAMLAFSPQTQNRHLFLLLPVILFGTAMLVNRIEPVKVALALASGVLGTALLGDANAVAAGTVNWGFVGGGGIAVVVMYLLLLDVGLRRLTVLPGSAPAGDGSGSPVSEVHGPSWMNLGSKAGPVRWVERVLDRNAWL